MKKLVPILIALVSFAGCSIRFQKPGSNASNIGEGEYVDAGGNITVAFSIFSYRAIERYDSTLFDTDSINAVAVAWVRDTFQNPIRDADVTLYVDSVIPINMVYVDSLAAYVAPLPEFFRSFYIIDIHTSDGGYLRAKVWAPTVGIDTLKIGNNAVEIGDTLSGISDGDAIIFALFPPDDRPILLDNPPLYSPFIVLISRPVDAEHGTHVKIRRGFTSRTDTVILDSSRISRLFPYDNRLYEFIVITANIDTTTSIPPLNTFDIPLKFRKLIQILNSSGILTVSDIYTFYIQR